jgi:aryl-alcohol dehydrogenase-like predicted oxidoreductase
MPSLASSKIIRGLWQMTEGHQKDPWSFDSMAPILSAVQHGFLTFDCADIYSGTEAILGNACRMAADNGVTLKIHTKFVPNRSDLEAVDFHYTERAIDKSLKNLGLPCIDLVQFHWWDYAVPRDVSTLEHLMKLQQAGKVKSIGLTNFSHAKVQEIIAAGIKIDTIQVQYSLFDRRIEKALLPLCREKGIRLLTYGSLLGGFLSEAWLGKPEPELGALPNRSLVKYKLIIQEAGGWHHFQQALEQLDQLAKQYQCTIAPLVIAALIQSGHTDQIIIGLSNTNYAAQNRILTQVPTLTPQDLAHIFSFNSNFIRGDVYEIERSDTQHSSIMRYNLNR